MQALLATTLGAIAGSLLVSYVVGTDMQTTLIMVALAGAGGLVIGAAFNIARAGPN